MLCSWSRVTIDVNLAAIIVAAARSTRLENLPSRFSALFTERGTLLDNIRAYRQQKMALSPHYPARR
jgi:hypothetical protein